MKKTDVGSAEWSVAWAPPTTPSGMRPAWMAGVLSRELERLDTMWLSPMGDRVAASAEGLATGLGAAAWWVGSVDRCGTLQRVTSGVTSSRGQVDGAQVGEDLPLGVLLAQPEVRWTDPRDPLGAHHSLSLWSGEDTAIAREMSTWGGAVTMTSAGGFAPDAVQWTIALFGDVGSPDLRDAEPVVLAVLQACLGFPRQPR